MTEVREAGVIPQWTRADRLRKAREYAGLEQIPLAEAIEVSRGTISNYESGRVEPRRIVVRQWALRTGVSFEWLWSGEEWAPRGSNPQPTDYKSEASARIFAFPELRQLAVAS